MMPCKSLSPCGASASLVCVSRQSVSVSALSGLTPSCALIACRPPSKGARCPDPRLPSSTRPWSVNIASLLISEFATTTVQGHLTVVNVFNRLSGPGPRWGLPVIYLSVIIEAHPQEAREGEEASGGGGGGWGGGGWGGG